MSPSTHFKYMIFISSFSLLDRNHSGGCSLSVPLPQLLSSRLGCSPPLRGLRSPRSYHLPPQTHATDAGARRGQGEGLDWVRRSPGRSGTYQNTSQNWLGGGPRHCSVISFLQCHWVTGLGISRFPVRPPNKGVTQVAARTGAPSFSTRGSQGRTCPKWVLCVTEIFLSIRGVSKCPSCLSLDHHEDGLSQKTGYSDCLEHNKNKNIKTKPKFFTSTNTHGLERWHWRAAAHRGPWTSAPHPPNFKALVRRRLV